MNYIKNNKYLYIYGKIEKKKSCYQIAKHMFDNNTLFDIISISKLLGLNNAFYSKYNVICFDYLATHFLSKNNFIKILNNLKLSGKKIIFHLHDLHENTFNRCYTPIKKIEKKVINKNSSKDKSIYPTNIPGHGVTSLCEQLSIANCQYIISYSENVELRNILNSYSNIKKNVVIPFHVETKIFKDYKMPKIYDVLLIGSTIKKSYNFRNRLYYLLKNNKKIRVKIIRNIEYNSSLSKIINSSWLTIATYSNFHYLVRKYFEISASKSVILGNMTRMGKEIWKDNYIHIDREMSNTQIINTIKTALQNKKKLKEISNTMYSIMHTEYNYKRLCEKYNNFFMEIDN
jgi:hypothetical protein